MYSPLNRTGFSAWFRKAEQRFLAVRSDQYAVLGENIAAAEVEKEDIALRYVIPRELDAALREAGVTNWRIWRDGQDLFAVVECEDYRAMLGKSGGQGRISDYADSLGQSVDVMLVDTAFSAVASSPGHGSTDSVE